jgi:hypothetical protein
VFGDSAPVYYWGEPWFLRDDEEMEYIVLAVEQSIADLIDRHGLLAVFEALETVRKAKARELLDGAQKMEKAEYEQQPDMRARALFVLAENYSPEARRANDIAEAWYSASLDYVAKQLRKQLAHAGETKEERCRRKRDEEVAEYRERIRDLENRECREAR